MKISREGQIEGRRARKISARSRHRNCVILQVRSQLDITRKYLSPQTWFHFIPKFSLFVFLATKISGIPIEFQLSRATNWTRDIYLTFAAPPDRLLLNVCIIIHHFNFLNFSSSELFSSVTSRSFFTVAFMSNNPARWCFWLPMNTELLVAVTLTQFFRSELCFSAAFSAFWANDWNLSLPEPHKKFRT